MALKGKMTPKTHSTPFKNFDFVRKKGLFSSQNGNFGTFETIFRVIHDSILYEDCSGQCLCFQF